MNDIEKFSKILAESRRAVFFGGAGMSTESGIPDFRSAGGIYNQKLNKNFRPEEMASHSFFVKYPADFFEFYRARFVYLDAKPNPGHFALAELERKNILSAVVTQNIDGLHQAAGSKVVYELHGSIHRSFCTKCGAAYDVKFIMENIPIPYCEKCGGIVKPDVVLYEESLNARILAEAIKAIAAADTLIIGGTSLIVYPAAGIIDYFKGKHLILINKSETRADKLAEIVLRENIGETLKNAIELL